MYFNDWSIALTKVLKIDDKQILVNTRINNKNYTVTLKQFFAKAATLAGWQSVIITIANSFCAKYLYPRPNYIYNDEDVKKTRILVLDYLADFTINAIRAGYDFDDVEVNKNE